MIDVTDGFMMMAERAFKERDDLAERLKEATRIINEGSYTLIQLMKVESQRDALMEVERAARDYFMYAVQDEAAERECCVDDEQHKRAKALRDALADVETAR